MLWTAFHERTGRLGSQTALVAADGTWTFDQLWTEADRLATRLLSAGVAEGSVVAIALPNGGRFVITLLAVWRLNGTVALVSHQYGPGETGPVVRGSGSSAMVADRAFVTRNQEALAGCHTSEIEGLALLIPPTPAPNPGTNGAALLKFSSGSTAQPKGIALTPANVLAEVRNVAAMFGLRPADRILAGVPLAHSYGFDLGVLQTLFVGNTLVVHDQFVPRRTVSALAAGDVRMFLGVPAQYRVLVTTLLNPVPRLADIPWLLSCTAPLSVDIVRQFHDRFGATISQHYGSSETGAVSNHLPDHVLRLPESVGRALPGVQVSIRAPDGTPLPPGAVGDVVVSSEAVARGYLLGAPETSPFREGSFWMGDTGCLDAHGFLTVLGRSDSMINVGGLKVSPSEVAAALERHPAVREAAVVGVRDARGEQVPYAVITLRAPTTEAELLAACRTSLAEYKVPRRIEIRDELPRTATGKIRLRPEDISL